VVSRLFDFWFKPIDPIRLEMFEKVFTFSFLVYMIERYTYAYEWLTDYGFHFTPEMNLWWQPTPLPTLPEWMVIPFGFILFGGILGLLLGWQRRFFAWYVFGLSVYVQLIDLRSAFTLNKLYIVGFLVLALAPYGRVYGTKDAPRRLHSAWPVRVLQGTILIQYMTAGWCKVFHGDWLERTDILWSQVQGIYCTDFCAWLLRILPEWAWSVQMYAALVFECFAPILIGVKRLRIFGVPLRYIGLVWGLGFQTIIALTMHDLIYFSLQLVSYYVLFLEPETLYAVQAKWREDITDPIRAKLGLGRKGEPAANGGGGDDGDAEPGSV
jgi:hypothetical protein